jgi:hypothetical protein
MWQITVVTIVASIKTPYFAIADGVTSVTVTYFGWDYPV